MTRQLAWMAVLGLALGTFSIVGDRIPLLAAPANAVGPWIIAAFASGAAARSVRAGAGLGAGALVIAVAVYYAGARLAYGDVFVDPARATAVWGLVALVVGGPLGAAGAVWSTTERHRASAVGVLAGLLLAEAIVRFVEVEGWTGYDLGRTALRVTTIDALLALAAPVLLLRRDRARAYGVAIGVGIACSAILALVVPLVRDAAAG